MHSEKAFSSIDVTESGIEICFNDLQLLKALFFIVVTVNGISISSNDVQYSNVLSSIYVIDEGIENDTNDVHPLNALSSMNVIDEGNFMCVMLLFDLKSLFGILVKFPVISIDLIPLKISLLIDESDDGSDILLSDEHSENAHEQIVVTVDGIVISFNDVQFLNEFAPIVFKLNGKMMSVKFVQQQNMPFGISVIYSSVS